MEQPRINLPTPGGQARRRGVFRAGEWVQLTDEKGRMHTELLEAKGYFQCHQGAFPHSKVIGMPEGSVIPADKGEHRFTALRPLLVDYHLSMPRGAQILYPKDAAQIIMEGDIFPGATVVEAGAGSGAMSMSLLAAVGPAGRLISFEQREDFAQIARANVEMWFSGNVPQWDLRLDDLSAGLVELPDKSVDRVVLDMLLPWEHLAEIHRVLVPGGVLTCYITTATQLARLGQDLRNFGGFTALSSWESLVRPWHVDGLAVRPDHRMVAHTGFIFTARRLADGVTSIRRGEQPVGSLDSRDALWEDESLEYEGSRPISPRKLRRVLRDTQAKAALMGLTDGMADSVPDSAPDSALNSGEATVEPVGESVVALDSASGFEADCG
ncbi:tRNA (adenine57-N1/adenine58-N1)-methyltransferase [Mobiluncus mulieris]|uniref:tRNA (Adenine(58)-N(1))-methyltransferase TrmI n=1 Tax=Mobiluncus mulieris TaxID=2052 RepID=A0A8G2HW03_9ACTO|nr:tRNA (adenine-N1)-methyltransferase [Mobiluncus mulieris]MBB5846162.1 tRNA (adenine57-N1/adenine58-N1)-methyltransferase [Mobiluncus mulieris]STO17356.1 tRNA (adenine(58)-N(1))-methyltransferase TrmI [Mobiluncus mulieris]